MRTTDQDKLEYWRNHIEQSKLYPKGIQAYCKANKIATSAYYNWRQKVLNPKQKIPKSKKAQSVFLPVVVAPSKLEMQSYPQQHQVHQLPDSRWVAEIITNVIRGLL